MRRTTILAGLLAGYCVATPALADNDCAGLPDHAALQAALAAAQALNNGGFGLHMWGTVVNRDGIVCAVAFTVPIAARSGPAAG